MDIYWNFIEGGKETEETNENYIAVKIPVNSNKLIVYGEFQDWASRYVNKTEFIHLSKIRILATIRKQVVQNFTTFRQLQISLFEFL